MDHEFLSDVLGRGGAEALEKALAEFAGRAGSDEELEAAVDLVCRVIADDTARLTALGDQRKAELQKAKVRGSSGRSPKCSGRPIWRSASRWGRSCNRDRPRSDDRHSLRATDASRADSEHMNWKGPAAEVIGTKCVRRRGRWRFRRRARGGADA